MKRYLITVFSNKDRCYENLTLDTTEGEIKVYNNMLREKQTEDNIFSEFVYQKKMYNYHPNTINIRASVAMDFPITNIFEICM